MKQLIPKFLESIPKEIEEGVLYISMKYHTASHKCPCGCGRRIVTVFSPAGWRLIFDGKSISLEPSIGNWQIPCKSHYWITNNLIEWAPSWSTERIIRGRKNDQRALEQYYASKNAEKNLEKSVKKPEKKEESTKRKKKKEKKRKIKRKKKKS